MTDMKMTQFFLTTAFFPIALQMEFDTELAVLTNKLWRGIGSILFMSIFMAFLIMVLADYLRAHFDIADQTRKGLGNR